MKGLRLCDYTTDTADPLLNHLQEICSELKEERDVLFNNVPLMMLTISSRYRITSVNSYWIEKVGIEESKVVGQMFFFNNLPFSLEDPPDELISSLNSQKELKGYPCKFLIQNQKVDLLIDASPFRDEFLLTFREDAKRLQTSWESSQDLKITKGIIKILSEVSGGTVSRIQAAVRLLEKFAHKASSEKRETYLQSLMENVELLKSFLQQSIEIGSLNETSEEKSLIDLVRLTAHYVGSYKQKSVRTINFISEGQNSPLEIQVPLFRSTLYHLIENAVKYSDLNSPIQVRLVSTATSVTLSVKNWGRGICPEELGIIFHPFIRGSNVGSIKGFGIGLAVVKKFAEIHQGHVEVQSKSGEETEFKVILPLIIRAVT